MSMTDEQWMNIALEEASAAAAVGDVPVGAVIVKDNIIVGRGWTQPGGRPHAEVEALRQAKKLSLIHI